MSKKHNNFTSEDIEILDEKMKESCGCCNSCNCGDECHCDENNRCSEECTCGTECHCGEHCECGDECHCGEECSCQKEQENACHCDQNAQNDYLNLARQIQADFDNYRRRAEEEKKQAKLNGQVSVIETFLPCLDTFKEAKKSINDENVLKGIEMIENKIVEALTSLGVEKINSIGQVYNPHLHNVIAIMKDQEKENDIILDEYQAGYKFNDKVIRYAKVIVNKKEEN